MINAYRNGVDGETVGPGTDLSATNDPLDVSKELL